MEKNTFDITMELADEADSPLGQDTLVPRNLPLNWIIGFQYKEKILVSHEKSKAIRSWINLY